VHLRLVSDDTGLMERWQTRLQPSNLAETGECTRDSADVAPARPGRKPPRLALLHEFF
jgi:hypothetical protein